jgi:DNA-binding winged helix-turn-helix (wHTH) protein
MDHDFRLGDWQVQPATCRLSNDGLTVQVRPKVMDLLVYLSRHPGEVISKERLLDDVWGTDAISESALTRTVAELRRALSDHVDHPSILETIPKRGYRLIAPVDELPARRPPDPADAIAALQPARVEAPGPAKASRSRIVLVAAGVVIVAAAVAFLTRSLSHDPRVTPLPSVTRVTFEPGLQIEPSFSPDGRYLAYAANTDGNFDVWVRPGERLAA